jgi:hypothetical protein
MHTVNLKNLFHVLSHGIAHRALVSVVGITPREAKKLLAPHENTDDCTVSALSETRFEIRIPYNKTDSYTLTFDDVKGKLECVRVMNAWQAWGTPFELELSCRRCKGRSGMLPEHKNRSCCRACLAPIKHPVEHEAAT